MQCFSKSHLDYEPSPIALKNLEIIRLISGEQKRKPKSYSNSFTISKTTREKGGKPTKQSLIKANGWQLSNGQVQLYTSRTETNGLDGTGT